LVGKATLTVSSINLKIIFAWVERIKTVPAELCVLNSAVNLHTALGIKSTIFLSFVPADLRVGALIISKANIVLLVIFAALGLEGPYCFSLTEQSTVTVSMVVAVSIQCMSLTLDSIADHRLALIVGAAVTARIQIILN
jgi:hypothetical protein